MGRGFELGIEFLGLLLLLLVLTLVVLALRRRWLDRQGGTFECSLQRHRESVSSGWSLGVGRYNAGVLEWFRFFSFSPRPRQAFPRDQVRVLQTRDPGPIEAVALNAEQRIVRVECRSSRVEEEWELAMSPESLTGLLSWLEAAPPGVRRLD